MSGARRRRLRVLPIYRLIPNAITLLALCSGVSGMRFALEGRWQMAVGAIILAAVLDGLDGRVARLVGSTTKLGAELDSLSDVVSFGVAPAIIVYLWALQDLRGFGWAVALVFAICCALRLARFNAGLDDKDPPTWSHQYFTGVPAPAGGLLLLLPLVVTFEFESAFFASGWVNALMAMLVGGLMVSRLPTFSLKGVKVPMRHAWLTLLGFGAFAAFLLSNLWLTLLCTGVIYLGSIFFSYHSFRRAEARSLGSEAAASAEDAHD